jgi:hypothetical protein
MTTLQLTPSFDPRPHSHQGIAHSPSSSPPHIARSASQASSHLPVQAILQSPALSHDHFPSAYPSSVYRPYQPNHLTVQSPHHNFVYPHNTPSMPLYSASSGYERSAQMVRTMSHAHPLNSAEPTASSRYSSSPHLTGQHLDGPASASYHWQMGTPALSIHEPEIRHINPSVFDRNVSMMSVDGNYAMSRSTSGASDAADAQRLMTPHLEYRDQLSPAAADMRKVSDSSTGRYPRYTGMERYAPQQGYPQPQPQYWGRDPSGSQTTLDNRRYTEQQDHQQHQQHHDLAVVPENEYERERLEQISGNRKLLEGLGLGGGQSVSATAWMAADNSVPHAR